MKNNIIAGMLVGIVNTVPGVSGGTIILLLGYLDKLMNAISDVFKKKTKNKKENIIFLFQVAVGVLIGLIGFAGFLEILFKYIPTQTIAWFAGMILCSIPIFIENEMKKVKINKFWSLLGIILIGLLYVFSKNDNVTVIRDFPDLTLLHLLTLITVGFISGAATIFPGLSGAMLLLIIGQYYLYKSYIANILTFRSDIIIPVIFIGIGILLGVVISAKITSFLLRKHKGNTLSFILGLILASSIIIIPFSTEHDFITSVTSLIALLFGAFIVTSLNSLVKKKRNYSDTLIKQKY